MNPERIRRLEKLLDRKLSEDEITRLRRIKDVLEISDHDGLWDVLTAMEYQRVYYEELPQKIAGASEKILEKFEAAAAGHCASKKGTPAQFPASSLPGMAALLPAIFIFLVALLAYGNLMLWMGYRIGSGQAHPPELLLRMPSGLLMGGLGVAGGIFIGLCAAKDFAEGHGGWPQKVVYGFGYAASGRCDYQSGPVEERRNLPSLAGTFGVLWQNRVAGQFEIFTSAPVTLSLPVFSRRQRLCPVICHGLTKMTNQTAFITER